VSGPENPSLSTTTIIVAGDRATATAVRDHLASQVEARPRALALPGGGAQFSNAVESAIAAVAVRWALATGPALGIVVALLVAVATAYGAALATVMGITVALTGGLFAGAFAGFLVGLHRYGDLLHQGSLLEGARPGSVALVFRGGSWAALLAAVEEHFDVVAQRDSRLRVAFVRRPPASRRPGGDGFRRSPTWRRDRAIVARGTAALAFLEILAPAQRRQPSSRRKPAPGG
jgi:hypothetical protein